MCTEAPTAEAESKPSEPVATTPGIPAAEAPAARGETPRKSKAEQRAERAAAADQARQAELQAAMDECKREIDASMERHGFLLRGLPSLEETQRGTFEIGSVVRLVPDPKVWR